MIEDHEFTVRFRGAEQSDLMGVSYKGKYTRF